MKKEWYAFEYERKPYLHNRPLIYQKFPCRPGHHDHCELCWARFSQYLTDLHEGYYIPEEKVWICEDCYSKYYNLFGWTVE